MSDKIETLSGPIDLDTARRVLAILYVHRCHMCANVFAMHTCDSDNKPEDWIQCDGCSKFACEDHWKVFEYGYLCEQCWLDREKEHAQ